MKEEEALLEKEEEEKERALLEKLEKEEEERRESDKELHYDYSKRDLGIQQGVDKLNRQDGLETAVKKPVLPFYCSIPIVSRLVSSIFHFHVQL